MLPRWPQNGDGETLFHLPGAELRSGSFPHSGLGWGPHKSIKNDEKHTTVLVTMGKVPKISKQMFSELACLVGKRLPEHVRVFCTP